MKKVVIPTIQTADLSDLSQKLDTIRQLNHQFPDSPVTRISLDIVDGNFAPNKTLQPKDLLGIDWPVGQIDIQLMVIDPTTWLKDLKNIGATRVYAHIEKMPSIGHYLYDISKLDLEAGLALDLPTALDQLSSTNLAQAAGVLLMSVPAGFSGQTFNPLVFDKIRHLRSRFNADIVVDGGLNPQTIPPSYQAGANQFALNSALWQTDNVPATYIALINLLENLPHEET